MGYEGVWVALGILMIAGLIRLAFQWGLHRGRLLGQGEARIQLRHDALDCGSCPLCGRET